MYTKFSLVEMLGRALGTIQVVDVGAMWLEGERPPYMGLASSGAAKVIGFEAVKAECDRLNARAMRNHTYLPYFVGDGRERTFHTTNMSMTSSLYEPNMPLLRRFVQLADVTTVVDTTPVKTTRLDEVPEIERIDYLKMDVQGAELDVIRGAERRLADTAVIQLEVEFVPMYKDQPLFGDLDAELRRRGFIFHCFLSQSGRMFQPFKHPTNVSAQLRQTLWAEAVYVRDFMRLHEREPGSLLRMAAILHEVYSSYDLAALCLQHHEALTHSGVWKIYMQRMFGKVPEASLE
jgi:FkbM family methyltransferase